MQRPDVTIYADLGVRPVINAATSWTVLGGTLMLPEVLDAMRDAAQVFIDVHELQERAGEEVARLTNNEAAYITGGAAAGITLSVLAARTKGDVASIGALIEGLDLPDEVIMHTAHRMPYDPAVRLAGARIRPIGNVLQTFEYELEAAFSSRTAAILYVVGSFVAPGALPLETVVSAARAHSVPVIVDAAGQLPPVANLWRFTKELGAEMAVYSGGKELRGPQSSGIVVGHHDWVEAIRANGPPHQRLARAMKVGKEEIAGLVAAVRQFVATDHEQVWSDLQQRSRDLATGLSVHDGVTATVEDTNAAGARLPRVRVAIDPHVVGRAAASTVDALRTGEPQIAVRAGRGDFFHVELNLVTPSEEAVVRRRLAEELTSSPGISPRRISTAEPFFGGHQARSTRLEPRPEECGSHVGGKMREQIETKEGPAPKGAYSQGIRTETLVVVSGQGPRDPMTGRMPEGIEAQTHQTLRNVASILEAGGAGMDDVIKVTAHLADLSDFETFDGAYSQHFRTPYPVRTTVGSQLGGILVEIDVIATRPASR